MAEQLDIEIDPLAEDFEPRSLAAACVGVLSRRSKDRASRITVAARGTGIRWLAEQLAEDPHARSRLRIVAPERLAEHVRSVAAEELAQEAVFGLHAKRPDHSAIGYGWAQLQWFTIFFAAAMLGAAIVAPGELFIAVEYFLALSFISWTLLRLACEAILEAPKFLAARLHQSVQSVSVRMFVGLLSVRPLRRPHESDQSAVSGLIAA